ncbi:MBL fold metallo-hydrolase [Vibrio vulnificus]|nr:MBL fold metallo-hydrolase [Vibrio vulnificus]MCU8426569.1 MBL fold metallo-hydrolase [Vibrio vulnificus]
MIKVKMYPAEKGDAFLITLCSESGNKHIVIDMGLKSTYIDKIKPDLLAISEKGEKIDLLIITHIDQDHIQGALNFIEENGSDAKIIEVNEVWHNSFRHLQFKKASSLPDAERKILKRTVSQNGSPIKDGKNHISAHEGSSLSALLLKFNYNWNTATRGQAVHTCINRNYNFDEFSIELLSPNKDKLNLLAKFWLSYLRKQKYNFTITDDIIFDDAFEFMTMNETSGSGQKRKISSSQNLDFERLSKVDANAKDIDKRAPNGSSIAFILKFKDKNLLFLADSHDDIIIEEINRKNCKKPVNFELIKVPHHGSNNNFRSELSNLIKSDTYLIPTDGQHHGHPNIEVIAKISNSTQYKKIIFNYEHETYRKINNEFIKNKYNVDFDVSDEIIFQ